MENVFYFGFIPYHLLQSHPPQKRTTPRIMRKRLPLLIMVTAPIAAINPPVILSVFFIDVVQFHRTRRRSTGFTEP